MVPQTRLGVATLTRMAFEGRDLSALRSELITQHLLDADNAGALMDLSVVEQLRGNRAAGLAWQERALEACRLYRTDRSEHGRRKLLVIAAPIDMGGNTPIEFLLQGSEFEITYSFVSGTGARKADLSDYDVVFCAAPGDSEVVASFFGAVRDMAQDSPVHLVNRPDRIMRIDRDGLPDLLRGAPGVRLPEIERMARGDLLKVRGLKFPAVVRPVGSHAGQGLARVSSADELRDYLSLHTAAHFFFSEFVEYSSVTDDLYRKYRVIFVDGEPYPCHMAISSQWDVWYLNAGMEACPKKRLEEAAFMDRFQSEFRCRHRDALRAIGTRVGLEYFGIDCAEDPDGNLLVFEADNALIVHDMDSETLFPYKKEHMRRIFTAFEQMLLERCAPAMPEPMRVLN